MRGMTLDRLLLVAVGGALGSALRYALSVGITRVAAGPFPWHTLAINLIGSFGLGVLLFAWPSSTWMTPAVRLGLTTGLMGGFTTYSTFNYETLKLMHDGAPGLAAAYVLATLLSCTVAGFAGIAVGRVLS